MGQGRHIEASLHYQRVRGLSSFHPYPQTHFQDYTSYSKPLFKYPPIQLFPYIPSLYKTH